VLGLKLWQQSAKKVANPAQCAIAQIAGKQSTGLKRTAQ
jgi:hypothetical protein